MAETRPVPSIARAPSQGLASVSVVVTSYTLERIKDLMALLDSLKAQEHPSREVIFVGERTRELGDRVEAHALELGIPGVKILFNQGQPSLSVCRNLGAEHAEGDIIAFIDDDAVAFPDWTQEIVSTFAQDPSIIGVTGQALPLWEDASMEWLPDEFTWLVSATTWTGWNSSREVRNAWGMNMSFRREAFEECRFEESPFGRSLGHHTGGKQGPEGDDTEFSIQLRRKTGKRIMYNPQVMVWHKIERWRLSPRVVRRRAFWQGYTRGMIRQLYGGEASEEGPLLQMEYGLLRRILLGMLPRTLLSIPRNPVLAWRRLYLAGKSLFFLALGYFCALFPWLGRRVTKLI